MIFKNIKYIDPNLNIVNDAYIGVLGDTITYVGQDQPSNIKNFGAVYDGKNKLLMPGFVNTHSHAASTLIRSYADNQPLQEWLNNWIFPFEAKMTPHDYYWATALGLAEMARFGITSCSDMYFEGTERLRAITESKMKCNMSECVLSFEDIRFNQHKLYEPTLKFIKEFHNSQNGRIKIDTCIHSEYTTSKNICVDIADVAKQYNLITVIHVSETQAEHQECKQRHNGMTPIEYFKNIGVLDNPVIISHGVWLEDNDYKIMQKKNVSLSTNPAADLKLGSGIADLKKFFDYNINLSIGTDGVASNNNHNFLKEIYLASVLCRGVHHNSTLMPIKDVFYAATRAGAIAQGRNDTGYIKEGFKADLTIMDTSDLVWVPGNNSINNLIYAGSGSDICLTMVDGNIVYQNGHWPYVDIEKIKYEVRLRRKRIVGEL